jgi:hypothetical protein
LQENPVKASSISIPKTHFLFIPVLLSQPPDKTNNAPVKV